MGPMIEKSDFSPAAVMSAATAGRLTVLHGRGRYFKRAGIFNKISKDRWLLNLEIISLPSLLSTASCNAPTDGQSLHGHCAPFFFTYFRFWFARSVMPASDKIQVAYTGRKMYLSG
jgi:hypothetical protein